MITFSENFFSLMREDKDNDSLLHWTPWSNKYNLRVKSSRTQACLYRASLTQSSLQTQALYLTQVSTHDCCPTGNWSKPNSAKLGSKPLRKLLPCVWFLVHFYFFSQLQRPEETARYLSHSGSTPNHKLKWKKLSRNFRTVQNKFKFHSGFEHGQPFQQRTQIFHYHSFIPNENP